VCPNQLLFGCKPKLPASLRSFDKIEVVTTKDKIRGKLKNRGIPCMFVGYSVNHAHDVYRMHIETEMIINSRDIIWLNQMHKDWILKKTNNQLNYDDDDGEDLMIQSVKKDHDAPAEVNNQDEFEHDWLLVDTLRFQDENLRSGY
jgi:hypothetical protein